MVPALVAAASAVQPIPSNDEFFEDADHALIDRLAPPSGTSPVKKAGGGTTETSDPPDWDDAAQSLLTQALQSLYQCEATIQRADELGPPPEEQALRDRLEALSLHCGELAKEKSELQTQAHELQGDTAQTDFQHKSTVELRKMIVNFEKDMKTIQAVLEARISA